MTFNRECEYALMGMAALAAEGGDRPLMLSEIAAREELPLSFLSKIFQKLLKHGLVVSHRGVERGYTLAREAGAVSVRTILEAIEGPDLFERCVFSHRPCAGEENPCLLHEAWQDMRPQVRAAFEKTTLQDVVEVRKAASPPPVAARRGRATPS
jgi:Rrf2 family iron-sulfur cluster assembly transcriptional regulator